MKRLRTYFLLLLGLQWLTTLSIGAAENRIHQESDHQRLTRFSHQIQSLQQCLRIPGLSAGIVRHGKLIWAKGYGYADLEHRRSATKNTIYPIASVTKTFSSTLVLQLIEEQKLDLNDAMACFVPDFTESPTTVKHILTHTSEGIPGTQYRYNHGRFGTLTAVLEKTSGKTYPQLLSERILIPLKMNHTLPSFDPQDWAKNFPEPSHHKQRHQFHRLAMNIAKPYSSKDSLTTVQTIISTSGVSAAGGILSSVTDMAKYIAAVNQHRLLKKEYQAMAFTETPSTGGLCFPYGLGWFIDKEWGPKIVWHYGYLTNGSSLVIDIPDLDLGLIVLANSDGLSAPFNAGLISGQLSRSPIALAFLRIFFLQDQLARSIQDPNWTLSTSDFISELEKFTIENQKYCYDYERLVMIDIQNWLDQIQWEKTQTAQRAITGVTP